MVRRVNRQGRTDGAARRAVDGVHHAVEDDGRDVAGGVGCEQVPDHAQGDLADDGRVLGLDLRRRALGLGDGVRCLDVSVDLDGGDDVDGRQFVLDHELGRVRDVRQPPFRREPVGIRDGVEDQVEVGGHGVGAPLGEFPLESIDLGVLSPRPFFRLSRPACVFFAKAVHFRLTGLFALGVFGAGTLVFQLSLLDQFFVPCPAEELGQARLWRRQEALRPRRGYRMTRDAGIEGLPARPLLEPLQVEARLGAQARDQDGVQFGQTLGETLIHRRHFGDPGFDVQTLALLLVGRLSTLVGGLGASRLPLRGGLRPPPCSRRAFGLALHSRDRGHESLTPRHSPHPSMTTRRPA
ncbi:hypothetical protein [Actinomadura opuntiae]|uniref:hypothetical protein n=1 Tax=Actinomadura sp. OS1-43 TaxID=604315 RepID=UPI00255B2B25|nr:hypothetical protein [Actinomadura sp. OS1-43]MDL4817653.1 hypothetical protein [Actinomadura sp. OS1-43]